MSRSPRSRWQMLRTVFGEALISLRGKAARVLFPALGAALAAGSYTAITGISATLGDQVSAEFDALRATLVRVRAPEGQTEEWPDSQLLAAIESLESVVDVGLVSEPHRAVVDSAWGPTGREVSFRELDLGALRVLSPQVVAGRMAGSHDLALDSVLVPLTTAERLGIWAPGASIGLGDRVRPVVAVFDGVARRAEAALDVLAVVDRRVLTVGGANPEVVVAVRPGTAGATGEVLARLASSEGAEVLVAPQVDQFRLRVEEGVQNLVLLAGVVALGLGAMGIANSLTAAVHARTAEIGLRRALGARASHLFGQLVLEAMLIGVAGGVFGSLVGLTFLVLWASSSGYVVRVDSVATAVAILGATASGMGAGVFPGVRAASIEPIDALRR